MRLQARSVARTWRSASSACRSCCERPMQRIGLSATQRPLEEIGRFVAGGREITLVDAGTRKELDLEVVMPVEDMRELGQTVSYENPPEADGSALLTSTEGGTQLDLAVDLPGDPAARRGAPLDDRLRQQPPARGAARAAPERARERGDRRRPAAARDRARPSRLARARAAPARRGGSEGGADPVPRRDVEPRARASTWVRSTS